MAENSITEPDWGEELKELKSQMNAMMKIMTEHLKMKGQEDGTSALMSANVPLSAAGPFIGEPNTMTEPMYGIPLNRMPMNFQTVHGAGSSTTMPISDAPTESLRVTIPPAPNMAINEAAAFNPNVNRLGTATSFLYQPTVVPNQGEMFNMDEGLGEEMKKEKEKVEMMEKKQLMMEEQLKIIQGSGAYGPTGIEELAFAPQLDIPRDFKVPKFDKYDGTTNPRIHLMSYCTKMGVWSREERFFMHFFSESLIGPAADWYWRLEHAQIHSWGQLATLFLKQYSFNESLTPTRAQLEAMRKGDNESFREYALRWRHLAAQIQPPLGKREIIDYFLRTLTTPFIELMAAGVYNDFSELIPVGERIEVVYKAGKLGFLKGESSGNGKQKAFVQAKRREGEVSFITAPRVQEQYYQTYPQTQYNTQATPYLYQPRPNPVPFTQNYRNANPSFVPTYPTNPTPFIPTYSATSFPRPMPRPPYQDTRNQPRPYKDEPFPNILGTKTELFKQLVEANIVVPKMVHPQRPPYPHWYNPSLTCDFHSGTIGHSIETCPAFKHVVLRLIHQGIITLQQEDRVPNINTNPLPNHAGEHKVNAIGENVCRVRKLKDVRMSMTFIWERLKTAGQDTPKPFRGIEKDECYDEEEFCVYHEQLGHNLEECWEFKNLVQKLMNLGVVDIEKSSATIEKEIDMMRKEDHGFHPFVLKVLPNPPQESKTPKVIVKVPAPFPYQNNHAVPWNYGVKVEMVKGKSEDQGVSQKDDGVVNVGTTGGFTRSGRYYLPNDTQKQKDKGKEVIGENPTIGRKEKDPEDSMDEEEFLKVLKHSEYNIVDQLKKTPARISLLSLIINSEAHRKALQKFLDQAYVNPSITVENFDNMVNLIKKVGTISFTEDELVPGASTHTRALHIALKCAGCVVAKVLVDNGSALNVLPTSTLANLPINSSLMQSSNVVVRAFDGTRRDVLGDIVLPLEIGPSKFNVIFQVMDIEPAYTMLLGRPWIHAAGAVPSTLHQKLKYIDNGRVITVKGEEDLLVSKPNNLPYVEAADKALETSFQALELDNINQKVVHMMMKKGFQ